MMGFAATYGGMMGKYGYDGYGMMGGNGYWGGGFWPFSIFHILGLVLFIGVIILVYLAIFALWKYIKRGR